MLKEEEYIEAGDDTDEIEDTAETTTDVEDAIVTARHMRDSRQFSQHQRHVLEMIMSMNACIQRVHGIPLNLRQIETMNLMQFIDLLAPNGIRFCVEE